MTAAKPSKGARTRERILRAAERQFADHGYDGVSARRIAAAADVQLALLSYHFQSKLGLYRAVFQRRIAPISERRREMLCRVMQRIDPPPSIEEVLDAFARPWVELRDQPGRQSYSRLIAREAGDPRESSRGIVKDMLDPIAVEFLAAMEQVLPGRARPEIHWAYHFCVGALLNVLVNPGRIRRLSGDLCEVEDGEAVVSAIVGFLAMAFRERSSAFCVQSTGGRSHEARHLRVGNRRAAQRRPDRARSENR